MRDRSLVWAVRSSLLFCLLCCWGRGGAAEPAAKCGGGDPCVFLGQEDGWVRYVPNPAWEHKPYPPTESWKDPTATIFLAVASFRDKLCPITLYNLFSKAKYPDRITAAIVQQNVPEDMDCLDVYCRLVETFGLKNFTAPILEAVTSPTSIFKVKKTVAVDKCPFYGNVRMDRVDARIAQGPTWARARGSKLLQDEEFCMQTDAHMDFVYDWDVKMMSMWADTKNEYGILSTYVAPTEQLKFNLGDGSKGLNALHEVPHLCMVTLFGSHMLPRIWGTKCARSLPEPKLTNGIWGAGLSFSKCHAERKSPYDPHTPQIFDGEEFSRSVRFWTWGYDIYTPNRVNVVHNYHVSQSDPTHFDWARNAVGSGEVSAVRIKTLLGAPGGEPDAGKALQVVTSRYGLGDRRTLDQFIQFSGVDTKARKILGNHCGNLEWVTFQEHPLGANFVPRFDENEAFAEARDPGSVYFDQTMMGAWQERLAQHRQQQQPPQQEQPTQKKQAVTLRAPDEPIPATSSPKPNLVVLTFLCSVMLAIYFFFCSHSSSAKRSSMNSKMHV